MSGDTTAAGPSPGPSAAMVPNGPPAAPVAPAASSRKRKPGPRRPRAPVKDEPPLPHPAEDLSADDDLLSWMLVDQLGCMPNSKLGVHPQQNKFVGPVFKTDEVLAIVKETVITGNIPAGMARLQEYPIIKKHLESKRTESQRDRFIQHLRRYLLAYTPSSRVDIHTTDRYSHVTHHPELAVYATRPLPVGAVLTELQGSVVPLPEQWRIEMDLGDEFVARKTAEDGSEESDLSDGASDDEGVEDDGGRAAEEEVVAEEAEVARRRKEKGKEPERGARRSDRTRRRDFSIVWSGLKRCYQLFLGPARFLNHDCSPKVELLRQGRYVTFRVIRPIKIGEEITTYYGDDYFGKRNAECLCLTCEQNRRGHFTPKDLRSRYTSRAVSRATSRAASVAYSRASRAASRAASRTSRATSRGSSRGTSPATSPASSRASSRASLRPSAGGPMSDTDESESETTASGLGPRTHTGSVSTRGTLNSEADELYWSDAPTPKAGPLLHSSASPPLFQAEHADIADADTPSGEGAEVDLMLLEEETMNGDASEAGDVSSGSESDEPIMRQRLSRLAKTNAKPWSFLKRQPESAASPSTEPSFVLDTESLPEDFPRCGSCVRPLHDRMWYGGRYFEHCARCTRHAFIFGLPWPAHKPSEVQEYPPAHLIPPGYTPRKISTIPLPSLSKKKYKEVAVTVAPSDPEPVSREFRRQLQLKREIAEEEYTVQMLRDAAWAEQQALEEAIAAAQAAAEAKAEARKAAKEEKKRRDESKVKGSGLWSKYEYMTEEEFKRREEEKNRLTSGTRRGRAFKVVDDDEGEVVRRPVEEAIERLASPPRNGAPAAAITARVPATAPRDPVTTIKKERKRKTAGSVRKRSGTAKNDEKGKSGESKRPRGRPRKQPIAKEDVKPRAKATAGRKRASKSGVSEVYDGPTAPIEKGKAGRKPRTSKASKDGDESPGKKSAVKRKRASKGDNDEGMHSTASGSSPIKPKRRRMSKATAAMNALENGTEVPGSLSPAKKTRVRSLDATTKAKPVMRGRKSDLTPYFVPDELMDGESAAESVNGGAKAKTTVRKRRTDKKAAVRRGDEMDGEPEAGGGEGTARAGTTPKRKRMETGTKRGGRPRKSAAESNDKFVDTTPDQAPNHGVSGSGTISSRGRVSVPSRTKARAGSFVSNPASSSDEDESDDSDSTDDDFLPSDYEQTRAGRRSGRLVRDVSGPRRTSGRFLTPHNYVPDQEGHPGRNELSTRVGASSSSRGRAATSRSGLETSVSPIKPKKAARASGPARTSAIPAASSGGIGLTDAIAGPSTEPPAKRKRGRPRGSGYLQRAAAAAARQSLAADAAVNLVGPAGPTGPAVAAGTASDSKAAGAERAGAGAGAGVVNRISIKLTLSPEKQAGAYPAPDHHAASRAASGSGSMVGTAGFVSQVAGRGSSSSTLSSPLRPGGGVNGIGQGVQVQRGGGGVVMNGGATALASGEVGSETRMGLASPDPISAAAASRSTNASASTIANTLDSPPGSLAGVVPAGANCNGRAKADPNGSGSGHGPGPADEENGVVGRMSLLALSNGGSGAGAGGAVARGGPSGGAAPSTSASKKGRAADTSPVRKIRKFFPALPVSIPGLP